MRMPIFLLPLLLAGCQQEPQQGPDEQQASVSAPAVRTYVGEGRDRLCLDERAGRVGLITYEKSDANCSLRGAVTRAGDSMTIVPDGDESCRVSASIAGDSLKVSEATPGCAYYCGPGASLPGKTFRRSGQAVPVNDLAGNPLC